MIIKIQTSIVTNNSNATSLIYNEDRTIMYEAPLTKDIREIMKGEHKKYFNAHLVDTIINIDDEVEEQEW